MKRENTWHPVNMSEAAAFTFKYSRFDQFFRFNAEVTEAELQHILQSTNQQFCS